jgi:hypothetical protein
MVAAKKVINKPWKENDHLRFIGKNSGLMLQEILT